MKNSYPSFQESTKFVLTFLFAFAIIFIVAACDDDSSVNTNQTETISQALSHQNIVKTVARSTSTGFSTVFEEMITDKQDRDDFLRSYVESIRFFEDQSGYLFVHDLDINVIAHPVNKELIGQNLYDMQDSKGKYFFHEVVDSLNNSGEGFIGYYFQNPATEQDEEKITFVSKLSSADYYVGSGYYVPDISGTIEKVESQKRVAKETVHAAAIGIGDVFKDIFSSNPEQIDFVKAFINDIRFFDDLTGYFFFYHTDGTCVAHPLQKDIEGVNRIDHVDSKGYEYIRAMCELMINTGSGYIEYYKYNFVTEKDEPKVSYMEKIPGTDYFIGAGVYLD